ncbi:MAG: hypothetical protein M1541_06195 [Acidobacteria bacterium]|nr:hypothetical protein [Acidobacteriota bacterium]
MIYSRPSTVVLAAVLFAACQNGSKPMIQRIRDGQDLTSYHLQSVAGTRDGDRLRAEVVFASKNSSLLRMDLRFRIGVPTRLEDGKYRWNQGSQATQGNVTAKSVTFLGGQSGRPSIGGVFELQSSDVSLYEIRLPAHELTPAGGLIDSPGTPPPPFGERRGD